MRAFLAVVFLAANTAAYAGGLYKWVDPATGEIAYSNEPPPAAIKSVEQKKIVRSTIQTSDLPYGVQQAVKLNPVTLYATNCGEFCERARAYLAKRGLPYSEKNPQQPGKAESFRKATKGGMEVPLLMVGAQVVRGFDEARYEAVLESPGYPKTPLNALGVKPAQPRIPASATTDVRSGGAPSAEYVGPVAKGPDAGPVRVSLH